MGTGVSNMVNPLTTLWFLLFFLLSLLSLPLLLLFLVSVLVLAVHDIVSRFTRVSSSFNLSFKRIVLIYSNHFIGLIPDKRVFSENTLAYYAMALKNV
jgi:hypothetical protein